MRPLDRLGLALLAGGLGLGVLNIVTWLLGRGVGGWRPAIAAALMALGLAVLAVGVVQGLREDAEE